MAQDRSKGSLVDVDSTDSCLIRTDDILCLASVLEDELLTRGYLAAEGYGARMCHLEPDRNTSGDASQVPNELWKCAFRIAKCCSVHELRRGTIEKRQSRNVLIYGHAVQLEHLSSGLLLGCLATSSTSDKQAFDVGLVESDNALEENCWFSVHPVSQQRSEGEKVREGDDVVLINIANERYLSVHVGAHSVTKATDQQFLVQTSFGKCAWSLQMFRLGSAKEAAIGYANGGDVISIVLQGRSECLSVPLRRCDKICHKQITSFKVAYATAREEVKSLWRIELPRLKFGGAFTCWGQPFRLRHVVTGLFLATEEENPCQLTLCKGSEAAEESTLFCFRRSWGEFLPQGSPGGKTNVMGEPCVKFGDCTVYIQHIQSKMWLGYLSTDRLGKSDSEIHESRLLKDPHANFAFTITRATEEQIRATMLMNFSYFTIREYVCGLLDPSKTHELPSDLALHKKMDSLLEILHTYFNPNSCQDERTKSSLVRKRQNLFMKQGSLMMIVSVMDRIFQQSKWNVEKFLDTQKKLYQLLVAMIKGNNGSCAEFAVKDWFDEFIKRLQKSPLTHELLALLHCVLEDSPQAVHLISDAHIQKLIQLLAKKGCDEKILQFLTSLCVLQGIAIRDKQRAIAKHALNNKSLFLSSTLQQSVVNYHVKPVYLSAMEKSAMSRKWYFEALFKYHFNGNYNRKPHVRIGWAHPELYTPFATSNGFQVTSGTIGHDLHSIGCDGSTVWVGECDVLVEERKHSLRRQAHMESTEGYQCVIGCSVDLTSFSFQFYVNGRLMSRPVTLPQMSSVTPACSVSGGVSVELFLGEELGEFIHPPPPGYTPLARFFDHKQEASLSQFVALGDLKQKLYRGPSVKDVAQGFVPTPIDTSKISLPDKLWSLRNHLAEHIHDVWSVCKISDGWVYAEVRNDNLKHHPCLKLYEDLSENEKRYDYNLAFETIATLTGLGYEVAFDHNSDQEVSYQALDPTVYRQTNGYIPRPIDLASVSLPKSVLPFIERMAENIHNIWAVDRIQEGWTYGISENSTLKQNPALVPYQNLSEKLKESNRSTALESFKCLYAFGARIIPPEDGSHRSMDNFAHESIVYNQKKRTIRGQLNYGQMLDHGQWYFEVTILTSGSIRVGWAKPTMHPETGLGEDEESFAFDGSLGRKLHGSSAPFGRPWKKNDIVGCLLDCDARTMCFSLNGAILTDSFEDPIAFNHFNVSGGFMPAVTLGPDQLVKLNFGNNENTQLHKLENYGFGPSQGYVPISMNSYQSLPLWYSVDYPMVQTLKADNHPRLTITRRNMSGLEGSGYMENILVAVQDDHNPVFSRLECIRLNSAICLPSDTSLGSTHTDVVHLHRQKSLSQEISHSSKNETGSYTVHIPPGQDPRHVLVGWTAPDFVFSPSTLTATLAQTLEPNSSCVDQSVKITDRVNDEYCTLYSSAFLLPLLYLVDDSQAFMSVEITSTVRSTSREIEFCVDGSVVKKLSVQTKADIKLYPTVIISPSPETNHLLSFIITENTSTETNVLITETSKWACCPEENRHHVLKQDDHFRFTCERTDSTISILVPWEDRVFNLREIVEDEHLSNYHVATLKLLEGLSTYGYSQSPILLKIQEILGQEELLYMMQLKGLPSKLRSAVFSLARVLFVQEKVTMRSFVKEENIVCLPPKKNKRGNYFDWDEDEFDRMKEGCMSATYRGVVNFEDQGNDILMKLKDIAFSRLNYLLFAGETECQFMTQEGRIYLLQPLIELCDDLLVAGVLNKKSEVDLLLSMLDPLTFPTPEGCAQIPCGLVARNLEEPIKLAICRLLHHIHDCQLHQRLQYVVACSEVLVKKIQEEQKGRFSNGEGRRSREFMSTPEQQIDLILAPRQAAYSTTSDEEDSVLVDLELFHSELCRHCDVVPPPDEDVKDNEALKERLQLLYRLVNKDKHTQSSEPANQVETETSKFHTFVAKLMMSWSQKELLDRTFIKELFSLLYRQYNRASEVAKALQKTFVVQLTSVDVSGLFSSVGMLRSLLTVGMGSIEERTLKDSLKRISQSQAFKENAELMRFLKVHITTLSLLKDYLGVTEVRGKEWKKKRVRKKDAVLQGVVSETVQACCSFLHSFTCINEHNQIAMFDHIDFLLKCTESNPELLNYAGHGPIDVASAIIHNNDELVLFLRDSQLEGVVKLLSQQFTKHATLSASSVKSNDIWTMRGANKCLEFLSRAVWCKGKYVKENALIVIRLLLRHSECLDPIINNQQGLSDLFRSALFHDYSFDRDKSRSPLSPGVQMQVASSSDDETESKKSSEFSAITPRSSSMFSKRMMFASPSTVSIASTSSILMSDSEGATLRFLADLLQLLGYCAPSLPDEVRLDVNLTKQAKKLSRQYTQLNLFASSAPHTEDAAAAGNLETSIARHTHSLLRDLIDRDDILEVLNIPLSSQYWEKFNPMHKEACLLFYDRVYGIEDSDQLYQFISSVSLPDLKFTISMASTEVEDEEESHHLFVLCDYVTDHLLPVMSKKEHLLEGLDSDIAHDTVESFLLCCYQFSVSVHLSPVQRTKVANFLATICRALKPSVLMNLMPKIFNDLPDLQPKNITTLKFLTEHYTHFKRYYHINSGWKTIGCGAASDEERRFSSSLCFKLLQRLCFGELEPHVLSYGVKCLKAVVTALHPSMYVAIQDASSDTVEYRPKQIDVSRVVLTSSQEALIENFCTHLHDIWALEMLSDEWEFDEEHNESLKKHPNLVHYKQLPQEERESKRNNVMFLVKVLLARGFGIIASKNKHTTDLSKAFDTVTDFSSSNYTPSPVDLSQVKASRLFTHISRRLAQWSHEQWAAQLMEEDEGYRDHPHFRPYEDLDDDTKEEKKGLPLDLLKFISFSGYNIVRTRAQTWAKEGMLLSEETAKFATLLFSTLLDILGTSEKRFSLPKTKLILVVVLPVLTQFLNSNAMVFHSSGSGNMEDLPRKEKSLVIKLLSQVWHFCQQNYTMICLRKTTSAQSPQTSLNISVTAECLTALCKTLHVKEFFTSKMLDSEEAIALQEFLDGTLLELETAQHQGKELSLQMFDFSFQVIVPCLSSFFKCISFRKDHKILQTKLGNVALRIFHCVYDFGRRGLVHFSFVTSDVYSTIGECLAAFIEAYPMRILESSEESTVISVTELMMQMEQAGQAGCDCASVEYIEEVVLPLLCSYMAKYWIVQLDHKQSCLASQVSAEQLNKTVSDITNFVWSFFGQDNVPWMFRAIGHIRLMIQCCSSSFLKVILQPMADGLKARTLKLWQDEVYIHSRWTTSSPEFGTYLQALLGQYTVLSRDLIVCLSMLTVFLDARDGTSDLSDSNSNLDDIFLSVTQIFHCWFTSPHLRRELLSQQGLFLKNFPNYFSAFTQGKSRPGNVTVVGHQSTVRTSPCNILKLCVTKLLKYHVSKLSNKEKLILTNCKPIVEDSMLDSQSLKIAVQEEINKVNGDGTQRRVVHKSSSFSGSILSLSSNGAVNVLVELVKIENRLHQGDVDSVRKSPSRWKKIKVLTDNRRRAVIRCFMSVPYFKLPMTRALNIFLHTYQEKWFDSVQKGSHLILREEMLHSATHKGQVCPLTQLLHFFSQEALAGHVPVNLYSDFGLVLSMYCNVYVAEDDMDEDDPTINYKKFAEMRARLLESQNQLCTRGAAVTILQVLAYTRGQDGPLAEMSIHLGIALLKGGNETVQKVLLEKLGTMDAEVLKCIESLIGRCSVLRWEGHERSGYSSLESHCTGNLPDYKFIWSLFRFLQLLCEGHNEEFQNYLRTQDSNSATINVVVCTVDYLLRLQESISDYCWYLSEDGVVGSHRREALNRAMMLSNQVLRTLTEYIQGPCIGNQKALASSRVWDATSGFLKLFASLQWKLGKNSNQIELLLDLLKVQKSLFTFLQSMLEGVEMNSITARIMANMLVEESAVVMDIMQFYNMFLELKDLVTAQAFKEYDLNGDGWISRMEFQKAMETHSSYSPSEINYMMDCADLDKDGRLDYLEFTRRFHSPAEQIGFDLCVLVTTLAEHLPNNKCIERLRLSRSSIFAYFEKSLGRIEIVGKSGNVERVYFEIKPWWMHQWQERQVQDSKREFIQNLDVHSQRQKLGAFIDFCEDTIFEIQHAAKINEIESQEEIRKAEFHRKQHMGTELKISSDVTGHSQASLPVKALIFVLHILSIVWMVHLPKFRRKCVSLWQYSRWAVAPKGAFENGQMQRTQQPKPPVENGPDSPTSASPSSADSQVSTPTSSYPLPNFNRSEIKPPSEFSSLEVDFSLMAASSESSKPMISARHRMGSWSSTLARHYYRLHIVLLILTALINVCLLSYKIARGSLLECIKERHSDVCATELAASSWVTAILTLLGCTHAMVAGILLVSYYHLKIPLLLFKREKQIARELEFSKKWLTVAPESYKEKWDSLVLKSPMFPKLLWDKQLKSRLVAQHGAAALPLFGMDKHKATTDSVWSASWAVVIAAFDKYLRYYVWSLGVLATNLPLLYRFFGFLVSVLGLFWSPFFFSIHLLDFVWSSTDLQNVLKSVMLNYRQVVVTMLMTCTVVYLYTVVAFNMFQKYYLTDQTDSVVPNCDTMFKCFLYHLNHGLRSGGGIADVIASAVDDDMEGIRLIFDMSFFFFVIIILLAIIQGLIIDSFGKLRNKEEAQKEEMQTHCFICGLQKDKLEEIPHGFEQHTRKEHHMAHYMFFLMHLIQKPETEFTGQESHVWENYCQRKWDFFPVAESFRHRKTQNITEIAQ